MKKLIFYSLVVLLAVGATSCKTKKTAYKNAFDRAKEKEVVAPEVNTNAAEQATPPNVTVTRSTAAQVAVRKEKITPVLAADASGLRKFSVVIGSFVNQTNANVLKDKMEKNGYKVIIAQNEKQMYRVIVSSFDTKEAAASERDNFKTKYAPDFQDIWLLERQE
jgi:Uncharacterized protein conserved in bacteria